MTHFNILIKHKWQKDWHQYRHTKYLVQDHAALVNFIYTPARVGEIFESASRLSSGRGLLYEVSLLSCLRMGPELCSLLEQDVVFVIFKNEKGEAELAVRTTRDAKGFTNKPHKRSVLGHPSYATESMERPPADFQSYPDHSMQCTKICSLYLRTQYFLSSRSPWPTTPSKTTTVLKRSRQSHHQEMGPYTTFELKRRCIVCLSFRSCLLTVPPKGSEALLRGVVG